MSAYELRRCCVAALAIGVSYPLAAASPSHGDLTRLSLEELGNIEVTSVSKKPERLAEAPASVYVITAEDIRRAGVVTLPEALRLAPNLHVARQNAASYAISARGMNGSNTSAPNRLLVMIDGRSVYSPLFSGVFWDVQDVLIEDIERIEVISGPGGTLWGVNAVNGVINVMMRSAAERQGNRAVAVTGDLASEASLRHGGAFGAEGHYVTYAKWHSGRHTETRDGRAVDDAGHKFQTGFRLDWDAEASRFSVNGNTYRGREGQPEPGSVAVSGVDLDLGDIEFSGTNVTAQWERGLTRGGSLSAQAYFDRTERVVPPTFAEDLDILDLQFQHSLAPWGRHSLTWGANHRRSRDRIRNSPYIAFLPARLNQEWTSLFAQDEIELSPRAALTLGARLERNDYTGTEFLPGARLGWNVTSNHLLWASASRAIRAPSRLDRDTYIPGAPPFLLDGGNNVRSEVADVYEIGYRGQPTSRISLAATLFHADYDHVRSVEIHPSGTFLTFGSGMQGEADGLEMWGKLQATPHWRLSAGFTALDEQLRLKPGSNDVTGPQQTGNDPSHTWQLRSSWELADDHQLDLGLRHVSRLDRNAVPAYTAVDLRYAWQIRSDLEFSVTGRNLTGGHAEYGGIEFRTELDRHAFVKLVWEF